MSHFSTYKTKLSGITMAMLKAALAKVCEEYGLKQTTEITDYYGNKHKVQIGLKGGNLSYGMGLALNAKGEVTISGDSWGSGSWNQVSNSINQYCTSQKIMANIKQQHANAIFRMQKTQNQNVLLEACY